MNAATLVVRPARAVVMPYSRIEAPRVVLRPQRSAARPNPTVPMVYPSRKIEPMYPACASVMCSVSLISGSTRP
ncbi:Uncharacterised protein [Mycobacteroides abscessus subsp. abscessus]|nr:Uncharacterised protein [Mycobacteroides abscessus subsp. abscessus]